MSYHLLIKGVFTNERKGQPQFLGLSSAFDCHLRTLLDLLLVCLCGRPEHHLYGDGEDSPNYIIVLLLSWVTCGIYGVYWRYKQANRMYRESYDRYGVMIEENGSAILLWTLLGYLTGGIGQLVADYFMIQNLNKTALVYNSRAY